MTGASRGIGKGIALALGAEGATVYVSGRTVAPGVRSLPGTVGETAEEVCRRGGKGVAVVVDHRDDDQVAALFDQIHREQGRLDILVNNAFAIPEDLTEPRPFWEKPLSDWEMVDVGVRSNFVAAWHAAKIMVGQRSGLMVAVSGYVGVTYTYGVVFGMCKTAVDRMARDMAIELQPYHVASLSLWQGLTFTERAQRNLARNPAMQELTVTNARRWLLARISGPGDRGTGWRPRRDDAVGRHLHHRRGGAGLRDHRHRWAGYPVAAGRARLADLGTDRGGRRPWTLSVSAGYSTGRTSWTA